MTGTMEANFDALVGPTHNYAGLSYGNIASHRSRHSASNPRAAALEGLRKMKMLADLGVVQGVLPPQERPDIAALRRVGFAGPDAQVLEEAHRREPVLLAACCSASSMWAANAATVSASADCADGRVHFTPANLVSHWHRALETQTTAALLRAIFADESAFVHHAPLPACLTLADEGAANHMRLCRRHGERGLEVFVWGQAATNPDIARPKRYPARHTRESCEALARLHRLDADRVLLLQQSPDAVDAGVFHNDVAAVANENVLLCHERAWAGREAVTALAARYQQMSGAGPVLVVATEQQVPLADAVRSYVFNSQLVTLPSGSMALVAPTDCLEFPSVRRFIEQTIAGDNPVRAVHYAEVRQSMRNGGGPACLRLRVVLTADELARVHPGVLLDEPLYEQLTTWVERHYRERLTPDALADVQLLRESRAALDELTGILQLPAIYPFQR